MTNHGVLALRTAGNMAMAERNVRPEKIHGTVRLAHREKLGKEVDHQSYRGIRGICLSSQIPDNPAALGASISLPHVGSPGFPK